MSKKLAKVTTADVVRVLADAAKARDAMTDLVVLIHAGECERLDNPLHYARRCSSVAATFSQAMSHFLVRAELQDRA